MRLRKTKMTWTMVLDKKIAGMSIACIIFTGSLKLTFALPHGGIQ
ncbi:MAG TPA: hypothetical protein VFF47_07115 [Nitrospirota bacterium]|nr:hypothetical protein [Nitrospirota bacterium]